MIVWINGAFGSGKTAAAYELQRRLEHSCAYDPENMGFFLRKNMPPGQRISRIWDCGAALIIRS